MFPLQAGSPPLSWATVCFISCDLLQSAAQLHFMSQTREVPQEMKNKQHKHKVGLQRRLQALLRASPHAPAGCQEGCKAHQEQGPAAPQPSAPRAGCRASAGSPLTWPQPACGRDVSVCTIHCMVQDSCFCLGPLLTLETCHSICSTLQIFPPRDQSRSIPVDWGIKIGGVALSHKNKHSQTMMASAGEDACVLIPAPDLQCRGWALGSAILFPGQRLSAQTTGEDMHTSNTAYKFLLNV